MKDASGKLVNSSGMPIKFAIYAAATGGAVLWSETQTATVENGLYSVQLGSQNALNSSIFDGATKYLGISAGSDPEMSPRVVLVTVPYAYRAENADKLGGAANTNFIQLGVTAETSGTIGARVKTTNTTGYAIYGEAAGGSYGAGVAGLASDPNGTSNGGSFYSFSPDGYGVTAGNPNVSKGSDGGGAIKIAGKIDISGNSVGTGLISATTSEVVVSNPFVTSTSIILLTVVSVSPSKPIRVKSRMPDSGFVAATVDGTATPQLLPFNYLIIN